MAMFDKKIKARKLREKGLPINDIKDKLGVSKSTVSLWCRDIVLSEQKIEKIRLDHILKTQKGRLLGAQMNKQKRLDAITEADAFGKKNIRRLSHKELMLVATALYWSEGAKSESTAGFQFINSDPEMILMIKRFLLAIGVLKEDFVCSVQINEIHKGRITQVLNFWKKLLELDDQQIRSPYFVKTKVSKVYSNYETYFGICRLAVRKSTALKYKMLGLIKAMKAILPV
jgi:transcriptional regulator with XRE-family HTH domain